MTEETPLIQIPTLPTGSAHESPPQDKEREEILTQITKEKNVKKVEAGKKGAEVRKKLRALKQSKPERKAHTPHLTRVIEDHPATAASETHERTPFTYWLPAVVFALAVGSVLALSKACKGVYMFEQTSATPTNQNVDSTFDQHPQLNTKDVGDKTFEL